MTVRGSESRGVGKGGELGLCDDPDVGDEACDIGGMSSGTTARDFLRNHEPRRWGGGFGSVGLVAKGPLVLCRLARSTFDLAGMRASALGDDAGLDNDGIDKGVGGCVRSSRKNGWIVG